MSGGVLLAIDPSLAEPGYAVIDLGRADPHLLAAGVFETKRADESKRKSVFEDDMRRVRFVRRALAAVIERWSPLVVAVEAAAGSKSAQAIAALAMSQTVVACLVDEHLDGGAPIYLTASEIGDALAIAPTQRAKKGEPKTSAQRGRDRKARKAAIAHAVVARLGAGAWFAALGLVTTSDDYGAELAAVLDPGWEGAHDAAAVALAAWERPEIAGLRFRARQTTLADLGGGRSMHAGDAG